MTAHPNQLAAFSMVLLSCHGRYLLLRRDERKRFAPGRWTGLGGRVESAELDDLRASALRELEEEAGIAPSRIQRFLLRRVLLHARPADPTVLTMLLYFTGELAEQHVVASREGSLHWVTAAEIPSLDLIDNAAQVVPMLIEDLARDPDGHEPARLGAAHYRQNGTLERISWA